MKIITEGKAYVQLVDLAQLINILPETNIKCPKSIIDKYFDILSSDCYKFSFIKFIDKDEIDFFTNFDYIINYNELKNLNYNQLLQYMDSIVKKRDEILNQFSTLPKDIKNEKYNKEVIKYNYLNYKINSVCDFLCFRQGLINMTMPEDVLYKKDNNKLLTSANNEKKHIRRLFHKRKHNM